MEEDTPPSLPKRPPTIIRAAPPIPAADSAQQNVAKPPTVLPSRPAPPRPVPKLPARPASPPQSIPKLPPRPASQRQSSPKTKSRHDNPKETKVQPSTHKSVPASSSKRKLEITIVDARPMSEIVFRDLKKPATALQPTTSNSPNATTQATTEEAKTVATTNGPPKPPLPLALSKQIATPAPASEDVSYSHKAEENLTANREDTLSTSDSRSGDFGAAMTSRPKRPTIIRPQSKLLRQQAMTSQDDSQSDDFKSPPPSHPPPPLPPLPSLPPAPSIVEKTLPSISSQAQSNQSPVPATPPPISRPPPPKSDPKPNSNPASHPALPKPATAPASRPPHPKSPPPVSRPSLPVSRPMPPKPDAPMGRLQQPPLQTQPKAAPRPRPRPRSTVISPTTDILTLMEPTSATTDNIISTGHVTNSNSSSPLIINDIDSKPEKPIKMSRPQSMILPQTKQLINNKIDSTSSHETTQSPTLSPVAPTRSQHAPRERPSRPSAPPVRENSTPPADDNNTENLYETIEDVHRHQSELKPKPDMKSVRHTLPPQRNEVAEKTCLSPGFVSSIQPDTTAVEDNIPEYSRINKGKPNTDALADKPQSISSSFESSSPIPNETTKENVMEKLSPMKGNERREEGVKEAASPALLSSPPPPKPKPKPLPKPKPKPNIKPVKTSPESATLTATDPECNPRDSIPDIPDQKNTSVLNSPSEFNNDAKPLSSNGDVKDKEITDSDSVTHRISKSFLSKFDNQNNELDSFSMHNVEKTEVSTGDVITRSAPGTEKPKGQQPLPNSKRPVTIIGRRSLQEKETVSSLGTNGNAQVTTISVDNSTSGEFATAPPPPKRPVTMIGRLPMEKKETSVDYGLPSALTVGDNSNSQLQSKESIKVTTSAPPRRPPPTFMGHPSLGKTADAHSKEATMNMNSEDKVTPYQQLLPSEKEGAQVTTVPPKRPAITNRLPRGPGQVATEAHGEMDSTEKAAEGILMSRKNIDDESTTNAMEKSGPPKPERLSQVLRPPPPIPPQPSSAAAASRPEKANSPTSSFSSSKSFKDEEGGAKTPLTEEKDTALPHRPPPPRPSHGVANQPQSLLSSSPGEQPDHVGDSHGDSNLTAHEEMIRQKGGDRRNSEEGKAKRPGPPPARPVSVAPRHLTSGSLKDHPNPTSNNHQEQTKPPRPQSAVVKPPGPPSLPSRPGPGHALYHYLANEPHGIASHDYTASQSDELSFKAGDLILVTREIDDDWLSGMVGDKEGMFPRAFVDLKYDDNETQDSEKADNLTGPRCRARFDFEGEGEGELAVEDGDIIRLISHVGTEWMKGELNGFTGIFPSAFVEIIEDVVTTEDGQEEMALSQEVSAMFDFDGQDGELSFQAGDSITVQSQINSEWLVGECEGRKGKFPATFISHIPPSLPQHQETQEGEEFGERHDGTDTTRHNEKGVDDVLEGNASGKAVVVFCTALYDYDQDTPGDLSFKSGDRIKVLEFVGEDWIEGCCNGQQGLFPAAFVAIDDEAKMGDGLSDGGKDEIHQALQGIALHDFDGETDQDLSFKAGDAIDMLDFVDGSHQWRWGIFQGKKGIFPSAFVESC